MIELNNPEYYDRRARRARELAEHATSPEVRQIHLEFASRYTDLLQQVMTMPIMR